MSIKTLTNLHKHTAETEQQLEPLGLTGSLILFGLPALAMVLFSTLFRPWLVDIGAATPFEAYLASSLVPLALIFTAALVAYHKIEGWPLTRQAFAERMRYPRLTVKTVLLGIGTALLMFVVYGAVEMLVQPVMAQEMIPLPAELPGTETYINPSLRGNWDIVLLYLVTLFFNIAGEELWWRGIILPRQELAFGRWTWIIHGLMWNAFHVFKYWELLPLLPVTLIIAFVSQRSRNNWPALIAHSLFNGLGFILVLVVVVS